MKILLLTLLFTVLANVVLGNTLETPAGYKYPIAATLINTKLGRNYFVECYAKTSSSIICEFNESEIHYTGQRDDTCSISSLHFKHVFNYDAKTNTWVNQESLNPCGERPTFYLTLEKNGSVWSYVTESVNKFV